MQMRGLARLQRERALANDQRAGRWARGKARRKQRAYVRENWRSLGAVCGGLLLLVVAAVPFFPGSFSRGLYLGSLSTVVLGLMAFWVVQATGTAPTMMGDDAEGWTARELRKLRRHGWKLINHVSLEGRDADHLLVGPGGAFAVETKWTSDEWKSADQDERVQRAADQAAGVAHSMSLWLKRSELAIVEPVVFLWGAGARSLPAQQHVTTKGQRVTLIPGPLSRAWRDALPTYGLTPDQVDAAWVQVETYCSRRDPREDTESPVPLALTELAGRAFIGLLAATAAFLLAATWLAQEPSARLWIPVGVLLALPAIALARLSQSARYIAWGWLAGVAVSAVIIIYATVRWFLTNGR
jgi:hypothetical protein